MGSGIGRAGFQLAFYIVFVSGVLLLFLPRGTAEFTITLFTFFVGLIFLGVVVAVVRFEQRKP